MWGGSPVKLVRILTHDEQVQNYAKSYTNGASEFESETVFPQGFVKGDLKEGEQGIEDYAHSRYFRQL